MENITSNALTEIKSKCKTIMDCCKTLKSSLKSEEYDYINCDKIINICSKVNKGKSKTKSKTK